MHSIAHLVQWSLTAWYTGYCCHPSLQAASELSLNRIEEQEHWERKKQRGPRTQECTLAFAVAAAQDYSTCTPVIISWPPVLGFNLKLMKFWIEAMKLWTEPLKFWTETTEILDWNNPHRLLHRVKSHSWALTKLAQAMQRAGFLFTSPWFFHTGFKPYCFVGVASLLRYKVSMITKCGA